MSALHIAMVARIAEMRRVGDESGLFDALLAASELTPLFSSAVAVVDDWIAEAVDLAVRIAVEPRDEVIVAVRRAELLLNCGNVTSAFEAARSAGYAAADLGLAGLEDRAALCGARALTRMGRLDDATGLFRQVVARELPSEFDDPLVPGLAFLTQGEAHLFQGRYDGAARPFEQAVARLPSTPAADQLRHDALLGLAFLDHGAGDLEAATIRFASAGALALRHGAAAEAQSALLLEASVFRGLGKAGPATERLLLALKQGEQAVAPTRMLSFPTERLRNLAGQHDNEALVDQAMELARDCGASGDLLGYIQLCAVVATLLDHDGRTDAAAAVLADVERGLRQSDQAEAAHLVHRHLLAYITQ
ncbi:MAG: hypothetical protein IV100_14690 [Myxococcales bacterium]|nr:hypothetical protein [Myxococcales bacterium]